MYLWKSVAHAALFSFHIGVVNKTSSKGEKFMIMNEEVKIQENTAVSKPADLPALCAYDIKWDTDGDAKVFNGLPERMFIPKELVDNDVISDYLSDEIGYCHAGFKIGIMFRGSILPYYTNWLDSDTFQMWFGEDILKD